MKTIKRMSTVGKMLAAVAVIDFIGAIIAGFLGAKNAALIMIGLLLFFWLLWLTIEVVSIRSKLSLKSKETEHPSWQYFIKEPMLISSDKKNRFKIEPDFLLWEQCTLMLWVLVPPKGQGLRDSPSNRYILAHYTGTSDGKKQTYINQFALRHTKSRNHWNISISNNKAQYISKRISIQDGLEPGWHHFFIAWDRSEPKLLFAIDGGKSGNDISKNCFAYWPERTAEKMSVGAWPNDWEGHYCETKIYQLLIYDRYLDINSEPSKEHLKHKPRS